MSYLCKITQCKVTLSKNNLYNLHQSISQYNTIQGNIALNITYNKGIKGKFAPVKETQFKTTLGRDSQDKGSVVIVSEDEVIQCKFTQGKFQKPCPFSGDIINKHYANM